MADALFPEMPIAPASPVGLGAMMAGGGSSAAKTVRQPNDYYPTPASVTRAFLAVEGNAIRNRHGPRIWEPCGRSGAIARVAEEFGFQAVSTDIVPDADNDVAVLNLLDAKRRMADAVVTNPPFALAGQMIGHLLGVLEVPYLALLLKSTFWHADERKGLWRRHRPTMRYDLTWRPDFMGLGAPTMECSWFVWDRARRAAHAGWETLGRNGLTSADNPDLFDPSPG